jgi:hypothetical protein
VRPTLVIGALVLATLALGLWALGAFEPAAPPTPPAPTPEDGTPPPAPVGLGSADPAEEPPLDAVPFPNRVRALALGNAPRSFTHWFFQAWEEDPRIEFQAWYPPGPASPREPPHSASLPALSAAPAADELEDVQVLLIDDLDPGALAPAFWARVSERVRSGAMGLLLHPGVVHGKALVSHDAIRALLPVEAKAVEGASTGVVAGVFPEEHAFAVTEEGTKHFLTRLVRWPSWSVKKWQRLTAGEKPWGTKFVHPAGALAPGAVALLTVKGHRGEPEPAVVASDPARGRVLWLGLHDLGEAAYRDGNRSYGTLRALTRAWLSWLAGATA